MPQGTIFKNNQSQAVRLPKAVAFPPEVKKVDIVSTKGGLLLIPVYESWDDFFDSFVPDANFMVDRNQPPPQERDFSWMNEKD